MWMPCRLGCLKKAAATYNRDVRKLPNRLLKSLLAAGCVFRFSHAAQQLITLSNRLGHARYASTAARSKMSWLEPLEYLKPAKRRACIENTSGESPEQGLTKVVDLNYERLN